MPFVNIIRNTKVVTDARLADIVKSLPSVVADALTCTEGVLTPEDIAVKVTDSGPFDRNLKDLEISITARDYPERSADKDNRTKNISRRIHEITPHGMSWSVCLILVKMAYVSDSEG